MKKSDVTKILLYLAATYGKQFDYPSGDNARDSLKENVWHQQLKHFRPIEVQQAVETYISTGHHWPPHPGQIIAQIRKITSPEMISGAQAWQMTINAIQRYGAFYGAQQIKESLPQEVWRTVLIVGLENIANSDASDTFMMNTFIKIHEQQNEIMQERHLLNPARRELMIGG